MITEQNMMEWAERYLNQEITEQDLTQLNNTLADQPALRKLWTESLSLLQTLQSDTARKEIRNLIHDVAQESTTGRSAVTQSPKNYGLRLPKYLRTSAIAAGLILISSLSTIWIMDNKGSHKDSQEYTLLRREIETIKNSQSKIIDSLNKGKNTSPAEENPALYGGTGFALTNDGYIATNYHVVKDANAIYIQTNKGETHKAYIVAREPSADVAILKVEDEHFRFGKSTLPYNIANSTSGLGQRVFTLGYPKDDAVYNEGYISCDNGYQGDLHSYQLELTANPGQSGAPILDKNGTIIALITGKQSNTTGTTYAVHSGALIDLVHSLPKATNIYLPENNRLHKLERTDQVKKIRDYICAVKVN